MISEFDQIFLFSRYGLSFTSYSLLGRDVCDVMVAGLASDKSRNCLLNVLPAALFQGDMSKSVSNSAIERVSYVPLGNGIDRNDSSSQAFVSSDLYREDQHAALADARHRAVLTCFATQSAISCVASAWFTTSLERTT
jgi:hypothetical protein